MTMTAVEVMETQREDIVRGLYRYCSECFHLPAWGDAPEDIRRLLGAVADAAIAEAFHGVEMAHRLRLPFFVSGVGGFAIMSRDLPSRRAAVQQAGCCGE